jgi:site-specific DNA-methyltransferase (cytosine-N4-specific)
MADGTKKDYFVTDLGKMVLGDSLDVLKSLANESVALVVTSPPYALIRKKEYGNCGSADYVEWLRPFGKEIHRVLARNGSFALNIGGAWEKGQPTRSLYHFKVLIMLCEDVGFHLAQEHYYWNPAKLPNPFEWCTVRRVRVKDSVEPVWWLSKSPYPKADNRRVLQPYSGRMRNLLANGHEPKHRPSGHYVSPKFQKDNGGSIPPNIIAVANTESNSGYLTKCKELGIKPHPARFPSELPEWFIRMCTDPGDLVLDPFAGSCVTGQVAERLNRCWLCCDTNEDYLRGAALRFGEPSPDSQAYSGTAYPIWKPGYGWGESRAAALDPNGGIKRA